VSDESYDNTFYEAVYEELFGTYDLAFHQLDDEAPHIDVYHHPPTEGRPFSTFITGGASRLAMTVPTEYPEAARRIELALYVAEPRNEYGIVMYRLARYAQRNDTWIGYWHSVPGDPIVPGSLLAPVVLLDPPFEPDNALHEHLVVEGDPVELLWVVPITEQELAYKLEHGAEALQERLAERDVPFVLDPGRRSAV
jgi:hypothetical protein